MLFDRPICKARTLVLFNGSGAKVYELSDRAITAWCQLFEGLHRCMLMSDRVSGGQRRSISPACYRCTLCSSQRNTYLHKRTLVNERSQALVLASCVYEIGEERNVHTYGGVHKGACF